MPLVWRYELERGLNRLRVPAGTSILSAGWQNDAVVVWAYVPSRTTSLRETLEVLWVATGEPFEPKKGHDAKFIGTVQDPDGFVWHIFVIHKSPVGV